MGQGQGSVTVNQREVPAPAPPIPGPPFALTSADNGLSVDPVSGRIVLGNDSGGIQSAILLNDREIPLATFLIHFVDLNGEVIISDTAISTQAVTGDQTTMRSAGSVGTPSIVFSPPGAFQTIEIEDSLGELNIRDAGTNKMLSLSNLNLTYLLGDIDAVGNNSFLEIFDSGEIISFNLGLTQALFLDNIVRLYQLGDVTSFVNGSRLTIDDTNESFRMETAAELSLFIAPQVYSFGNVNSTLNGSFISIDDTNDGFVFRSDVRGRMISLQGFNQLYRIGDIDGLGGGTLLEINDAAFDIELTGDVFLITSPAAAGSADTALYREPVGGQVRQLTVSGIYTPTLTNVANLSASTSFSAQWIRSGNNVTVSGRVDIDPTITATLTQLGISLPIASNLSGNSQCAGTAFASGIAAQGAAILGDAANNRAQMEWISTDVTNQPMFFTFTYRII